MSDRFAATLIRRANPRPTGTSGPDVEWSTVELLSQIEHRSETMETMERKTAQQPTPQPAGSRRRGLLIAAAAAAVVLAAGAVVGVILVGDDSTDVAGRPDLTPVEIAELAWRSLEAGNADGYLALLSPDLVIVEPDSEFGFFDTHNEAEGHQVMALDWYSAAVELGTTCTAAGNVVTCEFTPVSPLGVKDESGNPTLATPEVATYTIEDGLIVRWERDTSIPGYDRRRLADYEGWLEETYPSEHAEMFAFGSMFYEDFEGAARHRAFVQEWAASQ